MRIVRALVVVTAIGSKQNLSSFALPSENFPVYFSLLGSRKNSAVKGVV
jgi:hypothetical protein